MRKLSGFNVITEGIDVRAQLVVEKGALAQVYDNSTGAYLPNREDDPTVMGVSLSGRNPNTDKDISPDITSVDYYVRYAGGTDTAVGSDSTKPVYSKGGKLYFGMNVPGTMSGMEAYAHVKFGDSNDPTMSGLEIDTPRQRLTTSVNVVQNLSLDVERPGISYVGDGFIINPFETPQNDDGTAWQRKLRCQLYDGNTKVAPAHDGTKLTGNAFYFWYYLGADKTEIALTGDEEWFSCERYSDGTYANECTVDMAKNTSVTLVCRAGYASYGELADIKEDDGTISRSRLEYGYLKQQFSLNVKQPVIQDLKVRSISNDSLRRSQLLPQNIPNTHVRKQILIKAGGMTVNEATNQATKKREYTVNGVQQDFDKSLGLTYSDLVARCYNIVWFNAATGAQIGTGEFLDVTLQQLGVTSADNMPMIGVDVEPVTKDLFGNNYVVGYSPDSDDPEPLAREIHGNKNFLSQIEFMLFDTTTEDDSGTFEAHTLQRNNLLRYKSGNYAPTVGITKDMMTECTDNALYTDAACKNLLCAAGKYNAVDEWEQHDKALMAAGGKPRALYKKDSKGTIFEVSHKLRPWETTETKYSIGLGYEFPVYLLDQVKGKSGKVWKGIFTDVTEWDGIDLTPYKLEPTALGPGAFCTVDGKARNFFYLYQGETNCQGEIGNGGAISCFHEQRTYPRSSDVHQITSQTYCRANNKNADSPYPMAEGGYFALDTLITAVELMAGTKYLYDDDKYGSGISSNDGPDASNFFKVGGVKFKKAADSGYTYNKWGTSHTVTIGGNATSTNWSQLSSYERAKEQCMESQMAASMAVELGIKPTTASGSEHCFYFYGGKYYYMGVDGVASLSDGQMNARVYKVINTSYTDDKEGKVDLEFRLRMSLYSGAMLAGDVFVYCGGGAELVAKAIHTRDEDQYNNPIGFWLETNQRKWKKTTAVTIGENETFDFESSYRNIIPLDGSVITKSNGWRKNRFSYAPFAVDSSPSSRGDCMYLWDDNWFNTSGGNKKTRLALRFGIRAYGDCAPRSLYCSNAYTTAHRFNAGRAQALVRITQ